MPGSRPRIRTSMPRFQRCRPQHDPHRNRRRRHLCGTSGTADHPRIHPSRRNAGGHAHRPPGALDAGSAGHGTLKDKGAHLAATEQPVDTSTTAGKAFFDMLGVFAEFEPNLRRERQAEGIAAAKQRGAYRGRPPRIDMEAIRHRLAMGRSPTGVARELGVSRGTVYKARAHRTGLA